MRIILDDLNQLIFDLGYVLGLDAIEVLLIGTIIVWAWAMRAYVRSLR